MLPLLAALLLASPQDLTPTPPAPFDRVIELEITANDEPLIDGRGPTVVVEYQVEFEGTLHVWTKSEMDLFLRVERITNGTVVGEDDDSGGGNTPYVRLDVALNDALAISIASISEQELGAVELHIVAAPETSTTRSAAQRADEARAEVDRLQATGESEAARDLLAHTVNSLHATPHAEHSRLVAGATWRLGRTAEALGSVSSSQDAYSWTHKDCLRTLPADHPGMQSARGNLATASYGLGDLPGARKLQEQVLEVRARTLPADHPDLQLTRWALANTLYTQGDGDGARGLLEQVLEVYSDTLPADHALVQGVRGNLAVTLLDLGDPAGARELQEQVLEVLSRTLPADHAQLQVARAGLASTIHTLGDMARARELLEQALEVYSSTLPDDHPHLQATRGNLAVVLFDLGDLSRARELQEQVLDVYSRTLPEQHRDVQAARGNLASTLLNLGDLAGGRELREQELEALSRTLPANHVQLQTSRANLGGALYELGDLSGARELIEPALEVLSRTLPPHHPVLLTIRNNLARALWAQGDLGDAREHVAHVLGSIRMETVALYEESPRVARAGARNRLARVHEGLSFTGLPDASQAVTPELFAAIESLRDVSVASAAIAHAVGDHPELALLQLEIARLRTDINGRVPVGPDEGQSTENWRDDLFELATHRDALERELRQGLAGAGFVAAEIDAPSVAATLSSGAAAVSYLRYARDFPANADTGEQTPSVDSLVAFLVLSDGEVMRVDLGPATEIEELALEWRRALGTPIERGVGIATGKRTETETGASLRKRILDPVLARTKDVRVLHVVPDDFLHLVPLEALPAGSTKNDERVGDVLRIQCEASFGRLVRRKSPPAGGTLLALGGVDFDAMSDEQVAPARLDSAERSGLPNRFEPLRQTRYEVEDITTQYEEAFKTEAVLLQNAGADKETLRTLAPIARWLHLATHGWFAPETLRSQLDPSERDLQRASVLRAQETVLGFAPEALCGLALAGANGGRNAVGRLPGIITAEELSTLDLRNCELAVLSACETNVGIRRAGQGIQSLQAALHAAGARTAITSLWKVDDAATRRLFELFYTKLWKEKLGKADALWQAKMALRSEGHPVRDWAGWVLTGDPD